MKKYFIFTTTLSKPSIQQTDIADIEKDGLKYLSGYVVHKFPKKIKKERNSTDNQNLISILENFISDNPRTQRLITTQI